MLFLYIIILKKSRATEDSTLYMIRLCLFAEKFGKEIPNCKPDSLEEVKLYPGLTCTIIRRAGVIGVSIIFRIVIGLHRSATCEGNLSIL